MSSSTFDPTKLLSAADDADNTQLAELEKQVAVLGGQVVQIVRNIVESIHKDDKASVPDQIRNAELAKSLLTQANTQLRQGVSETPSEPMQPEPTASQPAPDPAPAKKKTAKKKGGKKSASAKKVATPPAKKAAPAPTPAPAKKAASTPAPAKRTAPAPTPAPAKKAGGLVAWGKKALKNLGDSDTTQPKAPASS